MGLHRKTKKVMRKTYHAAARRGFHPGAGILETIGVSKKCPAPGAFQKNREVEDGWES